MCMRKIAIFFVFLCLILMGIVIVSILTRPQFGLEKNAKTRLAEMPGRIEFEFASDKLWQFKIVKSELVLQKVGDYGLGWKEDRPYIYLPGEAPNGLPEIKDSEYHGPYRQSPDKTLMVSAISPPTRGASAPTEFVLVNLEEKKILFERKSHQGHFVEDVAWSPDSRMFVVLDKSSAIYLGMSGIFSILIGHPAVVCKFYLSIYDRTGNLLVHSKVASDLIDGGGQVSWRNNQNN